MRIERCSMKRAVSFDSYKILILINDFFLVLYIFFEDIQNKTKEAIWRIQQQAAAAEGIGNETLQELRRQGNQMVSNC